ncbi:hypothetical protein [Maritimibacter sp. DP1N21-5]|uniref:hypothetical protein n=1 Tax=Maritimibacter sp. DP1N21-5 TaxID=2836867 RepID=UPI001C493ACD|nr:hypothetical protein [Maritimibacter sp. DP1N21-5]MBV7408760.1 hypothetical protein [Maritimibacter sp. DP1N21-5]
MDDKAFAQANAILNPSGMQTEDTVREMVKTMTPDEINDLLMDDAADDTTAENESEQESAAKAQEQDPAPTKEEAPQVYEIPADVLTGDALKDKLAELKDTRAKAFADYEDGEITAEEYEAALSAAENEALDLRSNAARHEALRQRDLDQIEAEKAKIEKDWNDNWQKANIDYAKRFPQLYAVIEGKQSPALAAFDRIVRAVNADPAFYDTDQTEILETAHRMLMVQAPKLGLKNLPAPNEPATRDQGERDDFETDLRTPPETLRNMPRSETTPGGFDDGQFAMIERAAEKGAADGEAAYLRLTESEREQMLRGY